MKRVNVCISRANMDVFSQNPSSIPTDMEYFRIKISHKVIGHFPKKFKILAKIKEIITQLAFTCLMSSTETSEQYVTLVQSQQ